VTKKKNIIEFREGLPCPEDYLSDPLSPKLVIIDDLFKRFIQEAQMRNDVREKDENENNDTRDIFAAGETTLDADVFRDLSRESAVKLSRCSGIIMRNDERARALAKNHR